MYLLHTDLCGMLNDKEKLMKTYVKGTDEAELSNLLIALKNKLECCQSPLKFDYADITKSTTTIDGEYQLIYVLMIDIRCTIHNDIEAILKTAKAVNLTIKQVTHQI